MDPALVLASFAIGVVVGLTGMGGGALMTPMLVLFFGVPPLAAVSSDLVASAVMKPVGSLVHLRHGTVHLHLVGWLCLGSIPTAFVGVFAARALGQDSDVQQVVKRALAVALLLAAAGLVAKAYLSLRDRVRRRATGEPPPPNAAPRARPIPTVLVGAVGGLVVGLTSVGSGSLIIVALVLLYPTLQASSLVGTDLVQAVPLVASAAVAHILFGDFRLDLTSSLLVGAIPGVYVGARLSSRAPGGLVKRALVLVLTASALKLLDVPDVWTAAVLLLVVVGGLVAWSLVRHRHGLDVAEGLLGIAPRGRLADGHGATSLDPRVPARDSAEQATGRRSAP